MNKKKNDCSLVQSWKHFIYKGNIKFYPWKGKINMTQFKLIYLLV